MKTQPKEVQIWCKLFQVVSIINSLKMENFLFVLIKMSKFLLFILKLRTTFLVSHVILSALPVLALMQTNAFTVLKVTIPIKFLIKKLNAYLVQQPTAPTVQARLIARNAGLITISKIVLVFIVLILTLF